MKEINFLANLLKFLDFSPFQTFIRAKALTT